VSETSTPIISRGNGHPGRHRSSRSVLECGGKRQRDTALALACVQESLHRKEVTKRSQSAVVARFAGFAGALQMGCG
jgi:hypothetical protein